MPPRKVKKAIVQRNRLAAAVRARRRELGWTQAELAEKAECQLNSIGKLEGGAQNITFDVLVHVSKALKTTIGELGISTKF